MSSAFLSVRFHLFALITNIVIFGAKFRINMKKTIISIAIILVLCSVSFAEMPASPDPHDSLLFDGENGNISLFNKAYLKCFLRVRKIKGTASGRVVEKQIDEICGVQETTYVAKDKSPLKEGDLLLEGSDVKTSPNGQVQIGITASGGGESGSAIMTIYPGSKITLPLISEICNLLTTGTISDNKVKVNEGKVHINTKPPGEKSILEKLDLLKLTSDPKDEIPLDLFKGDGKNSTVNHMKTEFTMEVAIDGNDTIDIIKVYEGSVTVSLKNDKVDVSDDKTAEMEQMMKDVQSGKISAQEFAEKMKEYTEEMKNKGKELQPVTVEAGNKCTAGKKSLKVEPIELNNEHWWEF